MSFQKFKSFIKNFVGPKIFSRCSFAQEGEDLVVDRLLEGKRGGFYIEVGCHHPFRFSNTYYFYRRGWRGICIDPLPGTKKLFARSRKRDIVIEKGVSLNSGELRYFMFNEPALNTFDEALAISRDGLRGYKLECFIDIETQSLESILLQQNISESIDFMSVDVEGFDLQVLQSNNWSKFRPKVVIAEALDSDLNSISLDPISIFLSGVGYRPYAKTGNSVIYKEVNN